MLFQTIKHDIIQAMKSKDDLKRDLLRTLVGECSKETKEPDDTQVIATIKKFIKGIDETIGHINASGVANEETAERILDCQEEKELLEEYLPKQFTEEEIRSISEKFMVGKIDVHSNLVGNLQSFFKHNYPGRYNGATVSKVAKELSGGQ